MAADEDEEKVLRSVALQTAQSILLARQRAEEELVRAKESLEVTTAELAQSLAMMHATLESTTDAIIVTDDGGRVTDFNQKYLEMWRLPPALMEARDHRQVLDVCGRQFADLGQYLARIDDIYATSPPESYDLLELADGRVFERFSRTQVVDGRNVGRVWSFRDITGSRRAEMALRVSEARKTAILETALDSIITCDRHGSILEFNPAAERTFGFRRGEVIGVDMADLIVPPHLRDRHRRGMARYLATGEERFLNRRIEMSVVRRDGTEFPVELSITRISGDGPPLFTAYLRDITDRKLSEQALHSQSEWLHVTLSSIGDAVITTDAHGQVTFLNGVAETLTGWPLAKAVGRPLPDVFHIVNEQTRQPVESPAVRALRDGTVVGLANHTVLVARDGTERPVDDSAAPMRDGSGRTVGAVLVFRDITERHRAEAEREHLLRELREANRRKDDFLALLAHELRNPLAPLRNGLQVMRLAADDADAVAEARAMMDRQLGHMVRLIDDLLDVSRIGRQKMELRRARVALANVVENAVETARPVIEEARHELSVSLPPEPVFLNADLTRLAQVFSNLLTNSAKYTKEEGQIWLSAERCGDEVVVSVRDTGIGIPADALPGVFEMFSQVDRSIERSTGGLGIGLALVKRLVEMHGGSVTAESGGSGKGSTFTVRLPAGGSGPAVSPEADRSSAIPKRRILVVDDNRDSAHTMSRLLKLLGHEVHTAYDGIEAVHAAESFGPEVTLMDVGMPRMNGYDAARRIREQPWGHNMIIVALTGWGQEGDRVQSRQAGCDGHLVKPVNFRDLEGLLAELAQNASRMQSAADE